MYEKLHEIFEFSPNEQSPPPAPKHTTAKPKVPKKPAVPKFTNSGSQCAVLMNNANSIEPVAAPPPRPIEEPYENDSVQMNDDESMADDVTVASASFMGDDDRYDMSQRGTGHRKRKQPHDDGLLAAQETHERAHTMYCDELLDYWMTNGESENQPKPEPPINFQPDWHIDNHKHTALHWAAAMGDISVMREVIHHGANIGCQNARGETPLMKAVLFTNCHDKEVMPIVVKALFDTVEMVDSCQSTALHHAAALTMSRQKNRCSRYYMDIMLNRMQEILSPEHVTRIIDAQDMDGNTALHIAARNGARKPVRALLGRHARTDIYNKDGETADALLHDVRKQDRNAGGSSSPYAPDHGSMPEDVRRNTLHLSEAAMSIESKVFPLIHEKLQSLGDSFDGELAEKDTSERAARDILNKTSNELFSMSDGIKELQASEDKQLEEHRKAHLIHLEALVTNLLEQQQYLQLRSRIQHETSKANGHMADDNDVLTRASLAQQLMLAESKRVSLVENYQEALSLAGAGEKGEQYRKLIAKCVGAEVDISNDEILDSLMEQLKDDEQGREGETEHPDDM